MSSEFKTNRSVWGVARRGFSLTELAIVLGIMGIVLSALWGVIALVNEDIKRHQMVDQMKLMVNNIRDFYMSRTSLPPGILTDTLLRAGVLPPELIRDRSTPGFLLADHPWGSKAASGWPLPLGGILVTTVDPHRSFSIALSGLKRSTCIALTDMLTGSDMSTGMIDYRINGLGGHATFPVSPEVAATECINPFVILNSIIITYNLRSQSNR